MADHMSKDSKDNKDPKDNKAITPLLDILVKTKMDQNASLVTILQRLGALHDLAQDTRTTSDIMHQDVQTLRSDFKNLTGRLTDAESRIGLLEDSSASEKKQCNATTNNVKLLFRELYELEDRNSRGNLRILGTHEEGTECSVEWLQHQYSPDYSKEKYRDLH
ncbi:hypothetical protein NDU88_002509 [Pleurodeles waltl]|uniref:Uncharacterized protein n=1 Tax=Pleurodeles waltl TaxID=8319 RepID=A0AAV7MNZ8_PLEWA|nr:hypothetical protein NDU88_002509 [Pleurodeles waltl]